MSPVTKFSLTTVHFVRHAEADYRISEDAKRPLTAEGKVASLKVTEFLTDKNITAIYSSPYLRAVETLNDFAEKTGLAIKTCENLREHHSARDRSLPYDFKEFYGRYWADHQYKLPGGDSFADLQQRNITVINEILRKHENENIAIGTHGMALAAIVNYYDDSFSFAEFLQLNELKPGIVSLYFNGLDCAGAAIHDLFAASKAWDSRLFRVNIAELGSLKAYRYVVIFGYYQDRWLLCRAKERSGYETAGGHINCGESPLEAAKRELYEETGALNYEITALFDYNVHTENEYAHGQVFFAKIKELGPLPPYEMAEVKLFTDLPVELRFPGILPLLFTEVKKQLTTRGLL